MSSLEITNLTLSSSNTAPTDISLSSTTVNENTSSGTTVGTLSTTDADAGDSFTYALVSGDGSTDNGSFSISGSSLKLAVSPDYETKNNYSVRIQTHDGTDTYEEAFTITVTDVNDAPSITSGETASFAENGTGTVYTAIGSDPDSGDTIAWSIDGTDASKFSIDSSTGDVTFNTSPDYENPSDDGTDNVYNITVTATDDGTLTATKDVVITVTNAYDVAPVISSGDSMSVEENTAATTTVYTAEGSDSDSGDAITWSISGTDASKFSINSSTGAMTFNTSPDYENPADDGGDNEYNITVTATDKGNFTDTKDVAIMVTNVNEAPAISSGDSASAAENTATDTAVYTAIGSDPDSGDTIAWSIDGTDASKFSIDSSTGDVTFNTSPDYENPSDDGTDNVYNITVTATDDGTLTATKDVVITVTNAYDVAPVISSGDSMSVEENTAATTTVYTAEGSDSDSGDAITWSISGTDASKFSINSSTGAMTFNTSPDYENPADDGGDNEYNITVTATDKGNFTDTKDVAIMVTNVNEAPAISSGDSASAAENTATDTAVYTAIGSDPDSGDTIAWSISGTDASKFSIDSSTGDVTFNTSPDYENPSDDGTDNVYNITITATDDGTLTATKDVVITVTNAYDVAPVISSGDSMSVEENTATSTTVYTAEGSDSDSGDAITWSISGTDASKFSINSTGAMTFNTSPDYENPADDGGDNEYNITVTATDKGNLTDTKDVAITVTDVTEVTAANSTVAASPASVLADGTATSTITVTLKDKNNDPVSGKTVTLAQDTGNSTISAASGVSDTSGVVTFTVKSTTTEAVTYTATDTTDGVTVTQTAAVTFTVPTYTATINTKIDGTATDMTGVVLKNDSSTVAAAKNSTGVYAATVVNGTYNVYVDGIYTGVDLTINYAAANTTINYYTVAFSSQGGGSVASQTVLSGGKAAIPAAPMKNGSTFAGWYTDTGYGTAWNFNTETISTAMTLYAKWTPVLTCRVAYSGNSNTSGIVPVDVNSYTSGATVTVKNNTGSLAKTGNTFAGWSDGTTTYSAGQTFTITGDVTLTAVWTAVAGSYTATYSNNYTSGGTYTTQNGISSGDTLTAPAVPTRSGYTFIGWYKEAACVNPWNFSVDTITANTTLYAKWSENTCSVSGMVKDDITPTPNSVSGAMVRVMQGNVLFGETVTTSNGTFTVTGVPNGIYNLVVTKGSQEITVRITVSGVNYPAGTVTLPSGNKNSTLEVNGSGTPNVVVDKLNGVFGDSGVYTPADDNDVTNNGATVEIKLTVQKNDSSADKTTVEATMTSGGYTTGMVLDVDMTKTVTTSNGEVTSESAVPEVNTLITLIIPLPAELQGKDSYMVTRAHDYNDANGIVADTISTTANAAGERIEVSSDKTQLTLYVKYFSTYAIGYTTTSSIGGGTVSYAITATAGTGGGISPTSASVVSGGSKTFTITADEGYCISDVLVDGESVGAVGSYTFSNVEAAHTIKAVFTKETTGRTNPFDDVNESDWFYDAVKYVAETGLMNGTSGTSFEPNRSTTRGMIVTILWRLENKPEAADSSSFSDVPTDEYYTEAVAWAEANGIVLGYDADTYGSDDPITREQLAAILYRYAKYKGYDVTATNDLPAFTDSANISTYALPAMKWAVAEALVSGNPDATLSPNGEATRAQVAMILMRFIENAN